MLRLHKVVFPPTIVVVKKTFRFPYVFFYYRNFCFYQRKASFLQPLMPHSLFRNINMEKGIILESLNSLISFNYYKLFQKCRLRSRVPLTDAGFHILIL